MTAKAPEHWVDQAPDPTIAAPEQWWLKSVVALGEVIFSSVDGPPPQDRLHWVCAELEDFFEDASPQSKGVFQLSLLAVRLGAPLLALRPVPLAWMSPERRTIGLERFERTPAGAALFAVKAILCILYYEHPDAAAEIGFDGAALGAR
ncbi:MAG: hypothetical protein ACI9OJ_000603 [Myxococcota bacterium]|jgi:hypothetical protein